MSDIVTDVVTFARKVLGIDVHPYQVEMVQSRKPWIIATGGRRSGKSTVSQIKAAEIAFTHRGCQVVVTSANESSVRRWLADFADMATASALGRGAVVDVESMKVTLANGSEVLGIVPTARALRGLGRRVMGVVIDEASLCNASVIVDAQFLAADHVHEGAQIILVGPPMCAKDHPFRTLFDAGFSGGDPDVFACQWPTTLNPGLDADWLARERDRLPSIVAMAELDGRWIDDNILYYSRALMGGGVADIEPPLPWDVHGVKGILAVDFGVTYDQSVIWMLYRAAGIRALNPEHDGRPVFIGWPYLFDTGTPMLDVVNAVVKCTGVMHYAPDPVGVGAMPAQEIERRVKATHKLGRGESRVFWNQPTTGPRKMASHGCARWLLENDQFILPRNPTMLRQFYGMRFEHSSRGGTIENADRATHDDCPSAAALAMLPHAPNGGTQIVCAVQSLAARGRVPESYVEPLDLDVVETGNGLRVYQRPALQSVASTEVAIPHGAAPKQYVNTEYDHVREAVTASVK
jgi:hypothetical protein